MATIDKVIRKVTNVVTNEVTQESNATCTELATTSAESWKHPENVSGLCSECWNMTANEEQFLGLLSGKSLSRSWAELQASALAGCPICRSIKNKHWKRKKDGRIVFYLVIAEGRLDYIGVLMKKSVWTRIYLWQSIGQFKAPRS